MGRFLVASKKRRGGLYPLFIIKRLGTLRPPLTQYRQEDAHELLVGLLDQIETTTKKKKKSRRCGGGSLFRLFEGELGSRVVCLECGHVSLSVDPFTHLSIEISNISSLHHAIRSFLKKEIIRNSGYKVIDL